MNFSVVRGAQAIGEEPRPVMNNPGSLLRDRGMGSPEHIRNHESVDPLNPAGLYQAVDPLEPTNGIPTH